MEINHEEFITILKDNYEKMKDNLRSKNEKYEIMRLSSVKSNTQLMTLFGQNKKHSSKNLIFVSVYIND